MPRHLLSYWPWEMVRREYVDVRTLAHDASNQFAHRRIEAGDTLWYVTVPVVDGQLTGQLALFGRLEVDAILHSNAEAQQYLTSTFGLTYTVRQDANTHVFARPGTEEPYTFLDITVLAGALRFESPNGRDRLTVHNGRVMNTFELMAFRTLAPPAERLLSDVWEGRVGTTPPNSVVPVPRATCEDQRQA